MIARIAEGIEEKENIFMIDVWNMVGASKRRRNQTVKMITFSHNPHNMYTDESTDDKVCKFIPVSFIHSHSTFTFTLY